MSKRKPVIEDAEVTLSEDGAITETAGDAPSTEAVEPPANQVDPNDPFVQWLIEKLGSPKDEVIEEIDNAAGRNPIFRNRLYELRRFMESCFELVGSSSIQGIGEVINLVQTNSGPVDPNVGDTA